MFDVVTEPTTEDAHLRGLRNCQDAAMGDEQWWTWVSQVVRPALELFGAATLVLALAGVLPGAIVSVAVLEYQQEAPRAAAVSAELLAGEREFAFMVGGFGIALAVIVAFLGYWIARRAGVRSRIAAPRTVALCAVTCAAASLTALLVAMSESRLAAGCATAAALLVLGALGTVGSTQVHAALRRTPR